MKYKIGDIVQIVKVNDIYDLKDNPDFYIGQTVKIIGINNFNDYPYGVEFDDSFKGDNNNCLWSEDELDYPCDNIREKIIWNKLKLIADDINNLKETPDDRLREVYYTIKNYIH